MTKSHRTPALLRLATLLAASALTAVAAATAAAGTNAPRHPKAASTFNILVVTELSGPVAAFGAAYRPGMFAAGKLINSWGGILGHKVSITFVDDQSNPVTGVTVLQNALASGKHYQAVFTAVTAFTQALAPLIAKQNVVGVTSGSAAVLFDNTPYKNMFGFSANLKSQEDGVAAELKRRHVTNIGIIAANNSAGMDGSSLLEQAATAEGIKANVVLTPTTVTDATPQLQQLQSKGAEALAITGFSAVANAALAARVKLGWNSPVFCDLGCAALNWANLPAEQRQGVFVEQLPWLVSGTPQTKTAAYKAYQARIAQFDKTYPLGMIIDLISWDMMMTVRAAAQKAHSIDPAKIVATLETMHTSKSVPGYIGPTGLFAADGYFPHVIHSTANDMIFVPAAPQVNGLMPLGKS